MAYYKRLFSYNTGISESEKDKEAFAYARQIQELADKIMIGDIFTQKMKPKDLNGFGVQGTTREFVVTDIYPNFIIARAKKGGWRESFTYQDFMDKDQFKWIRKEIA